MKINWQTKRYRVGILLSGVGILIVIFIFPQFSIQLNLIAILATLVVLIWYTYDTHRIANQTVENSLRPLILRSGFIESWDDIKFSINSGELTGKPLEFSVLKNIVKDISGFIIINGKKYQLLFANKISSKDLKGELSDLEKKILIYLYDHYKTERKNLPLDIATIYENFGVKSGEYVGVVSNSKYIKTDGSDFLLTDEGIRLMDSEKPMEYRFLPKWGWMKSETFINAIFNNKEYTETMDENQIYLIYSDMEGNKYFTREDKNFSQNSGKL